MYGNGHLRRLLLTVGRANRGGLYDSTGRYTASYHGNSRSTTTDTYVGSRLALYKDVALATDSDAP